MATYKLDLQKQYLRRIILDLILIPFAFYLALFIHFDGRLAVPYVEILAWYVAPIAFIYITVNLTFGIYRRLWAYASFRDIMLLCETVGLGTVILFLMNLYLFLDYPLFTDVVVLGGLLTLVLSTIIKYRRQLLVMFLASWSRSTSAPVERVLIVGVNELALRLATQLYLGGGHEKSYEVVGFVDDNPHHQGRNINGLEVLGTSIQIPEIILDKQVDVIAITYRPGNAEAMWRLFSTCQETSAQIKVLPDVIELMESRYEDPLALRDISVEDILGRPPATIDAELCSRILAGKVILVTGAAGSIGSELCRQILQFKPQLLLALDNNETGLYELNLELNPSGKLPLQIIVADITDWYRINRCFQQNKPQVVFHAAAYKHVPLVEGNPEEAVRVNVMGTVIVSEAAHQHEAERFVFISTDKAVKPSSVMGASKRIGELRMKALAQYSKTIFTSVRFGNVIGSRGSVLPTFTRQIEQGSPLTITHPEMCRFFMSISEAVSLVLQAAAFSHSSEIFMLEMGEEVSILSLAQRMIRLQGLRVNKDIKIEFVGMRPGEKLHEELAYSCERKEETPHPHIYSLYSRDELIDNDTLVGVISIMVHCLRLPNGEQLVRKNIFQVASGDIDGFLYNVTGLELKRSRRSNGAMRKAKAGGQIILSTPKAQLQF